MHVVGVQLWQRIVEVRVNHDPIVAWHAASHRTLDRLERRNRFAGAGDDDSFTPLDGRKKPREVGLGLMDVDGGRHVAMVT